MVILGPTGCGKSTLLNIIAGLEHQDSGNIYFNNRLINNIPPEKRGVGLVFQNFALFPHMTVFENVAYGLKARNETRENIARLVNEKLELLGISALKGRYPNEISGGEQQRVALARALVIEPELLLLDEPFSNLDPKVRDQLRVELKRLQKILGITAIHVTHDQSEAYSIADRIAVMGNKRIEQVGSPDDIFYKPQTEYIAWFVDANSFEGKIVEIHEDQGIMKIDSSGILIAAAFKEGIRLGDHVKAFIRPEEILIMPSEYPTSARNVIKGKITSITPLRGLEQIAATVEGRKEVKVEVTRSAAAELNLHVGKEVYLAFKASAIHIIKK
jgi:molybdopterin-binding protein